MQQTTKPSPILPVFCLFFTMLLLPANNLMAASVLAVIPMLLLYSVFQRQFIEGIATSGGKL